ncbi:MAG: sugar transporter [Massilibacteroides sp.]|nr:sugar transporter [Massilibacteroides sp.]
MTNSRVHKSLTNIKVGLFFYLLSLFLAFFSRKIFLDNLGSEFIGLVGTLNSILGFLNIAELGIGSSVCFFLYKPIEQKDKKVINDILSILGFIYHRIGFFILIAGVLCSLFFPIIFKHSIDLKIVYFSFYSFLLSSVSGYFINYLQIFLSADQRNYVVSIYTQTISIVKTGIQIFLAYYYKNLYLWVGIELFFGIISYILINRRIRKEYIWLKTNASRGKALVGRYPEIILKTKQIFIQKIKDFILTKSDEIFVFSFISLQMVAYYGNYMLILNKIIYLVNVFFNGMGTGVGNLVAENNSKNTSKVFWELTALRFFITGFVVFGLLLFMQPFIFCWLGTKYFLNDIILYLLLINLFIMFSRGVVEMYIHAYGLYADVWASWVEVIVNITLTLTMAKFFGLVGILYGKILSVAGIALLWKPYYLFKAGLKQPYINYWKGMFSYYLIFVLFIVLIIPIRFFIIDIKVHNFLTLALYILYIIPPLMIFYFLVLYQFTKGMKYFVDRVPLLSKILKNRNRR